MFVPTHKEDPATKAKNIYDLALEKILVCKTDVVCREGVFKKHAVVFPVIVNYKIIALYDLRNWDCGHIPSEDCPVGNLQKGIALSDFDKTFTIDETSSEFYTKMLQQKQTLNKKTAQYEESSSASLQMAFLSLGAGAFALPMKAEIVGILFFFLSGIMFFNALVHALIKRHVYKELRISLETTKEKLFDSIIKEEQFSGYNDEYVESIKSLITLAQIPYTENKGLLKANYERGE